MNTSNFKSQWNEILNILSLELGETTVNSWLKPLSVLEPDNDEVILEAPTKFIKNWVEKNYDAQIKQLWEKINPTIKKITYTVNTDNFPFMQNNQSISSLKKIVAEEPEAAHFNKYRRLDL